MDGGKRENGSVLLFIPPFFSLSVSFRFVSFRFILFLFSFLYVSCCFFVISFSSAIHLPQEVGGRYEGKKEKEKEVGKKGENMIGGSARIKLKSILKKNSVIFAQDPI